MTDSARQSTSVSLEEYDDLGYHHRRVLGIVCANSNKVQGEWVRARQVSTIASHASLGLSAEEINEILEGLADADLLRIESNRVAPAEGIDRVQHPGSR